MKTIIRAHQPWYRIDWWELYEYRDLLWFLVLRDFTAVYKQSILGPLWFIIQPLATTLVFTVIFGNIAKIGTDGVPPMIFYMGGMVLWNYFQGCMNSVSTALISNANVFGKVYFPRLIVPLSQVISNLGQFFLNLVMFLAFYFYFVWVKDAPIHMTGYVAYIPLLVIQCGVIGLGVGLWLSALTAKYRDLRFALPFLSQLWMYATPIVYPSSLVSEKWQWIIALNPMAWVVELNRVAFLGVGTLNGQFVILGLAVGFVLLVSGLFMFNKIQRTFVDTI